MPQSAMRLFQYLSRQHHVHRTASCQTSAVRRNSDRSVGLAVGYTYQPGGNSMRRRRDLLVAATFLVALAALTMGQKILATRAVAEAAGVQAPMFEVDPLWP